MVSYATAFIFYTFAMIGILLIGFVVYKKVFQVNNGENKGLIKILDSLPIGNKKQLLVVKIKDEKFLIASGLEHTTFLSKLESNQSAREEIITPEVVEDSVIDEIYAENFAPKKQVRFDDYKNLKESKAQELQKQFRELYEKEENPQAKYSTNKNEMIKQLLKEINSEKNASNGVKFNG